MLKINQVEVLTDDKGKSKVHSETLEDAFNLFCSYSKIRDVKPTLKFLTYNQLPKHFNYMAPARFEPIQSMSKVVGIELILNDGKPETETILIESTVRILGFTNRMITTMGAESLKWLAGGTPRVAYISDDWWDEYQKSKNSDDPLKVINDLDAKFIKDRKEKIDFKEVKRVFDYDDAYASQESRKEKKAGRPKKTIGFNLPEIKDKSVARVIIPDTSFVICNRMFVK